MRLDISMESFRCFSAVGPVRVAPITLLIGENSTGKTSFLAALRLLVEAFSRPSANSFNREPYFLGSFEQIAHYRGGRYGRAKDFWLKIDLLSGEEERDLLSNARRPRKTASLAIRFAKGTGQPEVAEYKFEAKGLIATFDLSGPKPQITVKRPDVPDLRIDPGRAPSSRMLRSEVSHLMYYMQDVLFRMQRHRDEPVEDESASSIHALTASLRLSQRTMAKSVFASAPVRIQPNRVYIPSELTSTNSGEQVPLDMANLKLTSPRRWLDTKDKLNQFGQKSGLFRDIEVKRLGKTDSDPFQIQIKTEGPAANLVDVGYGVSQALPLLYPLQLENEYDFYLLQQPEVHLHPKAQAEFGSLLTSLSARKPTYTYVVETHSDFIVDRVRTDVRDGVIRPQDVSILLFRRTGIDVTIQNIGIDRKGQIVGQPENYREFFLQEHARVLGL